MKRIIDGVTYNTDTSTLIAQSDDMDGDWEAGGYGSRTTWRLYQTRGGAFFEHRDMVMRHRDPDTGEWHEEERHSFLRKTRDEAHTWVMTGETEVFADVFGEPPEATAEESAAATIYVRMPSTLKDRVETAAKSDALSVNAWAVRCMERCLAEKRA